ncbi:MAG: HNH endonuclease [Candidatus Binatia bacterium]
MPTRKCIYCLETLELSAFDTEHVLPVAFGTFNDNLTLNEEVCEGCNSYFGRTLDFFLARDSIEALRRLTHGIKRLEEVEDLPLERLSLRLAQEGEWKGVRMRLRVKGGGLGVEAMPQVGLAKKGVQGRTYLTDKELADPTTAIPNDWDLGAGINVVAPSEGAADRLIRLLAERGITGQKKVDLPWAEGEGGRIWVEITSRIDQIIRRSIAKIAFNYMAHEQGAHFACHSDFNEARRFIRYDASPSYPVVDAIRSDSSATKSQRSVETKWHVIILEWREFEHQVVGQVSLFNEITYMVTLARYLSGVWRDIRSGHKFDTSKRQVERLRYTRLRLPRSNARRR